MDLQLIGQIQQWVKLNRPELSNEEKERLVNTVYIAVKPMVKDASPQGKSIITNEYLLENCSLSAYKMIRDVFESELPIQFKMYQQTPILFEIIEEALYIAVDDGIFAYKTEIVKSDYFSNKDARQKIFMIIQDVIA